MNVHELAAAWWSWIEPVSLQAALFAACVVAFDLVARARAWPAVRAALWWLVALRLAAPPHWTSPWSVLPPPEAVAAAGAGAAHDASALPTWPSVLCLLWLAGVALALVRDVRAGHALRCELARTHGAPETLEQRVARLARRLGLRRSPRVRVSASFESPVVVGWWRATLVVPSSMLDVACERRDLTLAVMHELTHLRRAHAWHALALRLLRAVFWFHPAAWLASRRLAELRELACDDAVTRGRSRRAQAYRDALLRVAGRVHAIPEPASAFVAGSSLFLRLDCLERRATKLRALHAPIAALVFAGACACLLPASPAAQALAAASPELRHALERLRSALDSDERQNCLELQAAAQLVYAHRQVTGEDLFAALVRERAAGPSPEAPGPRKE